MSRIGVRATDAIVQAVVEDALLAGASALRAAAAGYVAAMGEHAGVLLGASSILYSGFGASRAFDGRLRQPGLGAKRPRGWLQLAEVPDAAFCAAPLNIAALFIALTYDEDRRNSMVFRPGVAKARAAGAVERARLIELIEARGANAWADPLLHKPILNQVGVVEGGLLSKGDFECGDAVDFAAVRNENGAELHEPWASPGTDSGPDSVIEGICAVDRRGGAVAITYERCIFGVSIPEWEIVAPRRAKPVLRGVPRVSPGMRLEMTTAGRIQLSDSGSLVTGVEMSTEPPLRVFAPA